MVELATACLKADKLHLPMDRVDLLIASLIAGKHFSLPMKLQLVTDFTSHPLFASCLLKPYLVLVQEEMNSSR